MVSRVFGSSPFDAQQTIAPAAIAPRASASVARTADDGTATTIMSAPRTARSMSAVTVNPGASLRPGR